MATHGLGREVLFECHADGTVVSVAGNDFTPLGLVVLAGVEVLASVDVSNALSMVEFGGGTVNT